MFIILFFCLIIYVSCFWVTKQITNLRCYDIMIGTYWFNWIQGISVFVYINLFDNIVISEETVEYLIRCCSLRFCSMLSIHLSQICLEIGLSLKVPDIPWFPELSMVSISWSQKSPFSVCDIIICAKYAQGSFSVFFDRNVNIYLSSTISR